MNFLFLMDPLETVIFEKDTTFVFMLEAKRRGYKVFYLPSDGISLKDGKLYFNVVSVVPQNNRNKPFIVGKPSILNEDQVNCLFIRTDPPFNEKYLHNTWLLDQAVTKFPVLNHPSGIRTVNEKIWAMQFSSLQPPTLVSSNRTEILKFIHDHKNVVVKPTDGHGGKGIFRVLEGDLNTNVIIETLSEQFRKPIIVQKFIKESAKGDKRIILLNGEPLGAMLRVHGKNDYRNNLFAGGSAQKATITLRDRQIIETLRPFLKDLGLYFVGIDILGDYLTEVNVTSPTCVQEINRLNKVRLEKQVIDFAENLMRTRLMGQREHKS